MTTTAIQEGGRTRLHVGTSTRIIWLGGICLFGLLLGSSQAAEPKPNLLALLISDQGVVAQLLGSDNLGALALQDLGLTGAAATGAAGSGSPLTALIPAAPTDGGGNDSLLVALLGGIPIVGDLLFPPAPEVTARLPSEPPAAIGDLDGDGQRVDAGPRFGEFLTQIDPEAGFDESMVTLEDYSKAPSLPELGP